MPKLAPFGARVRQVPLGCDAVPAAPAVDVPGQRLSVTDYVAMTVARGEAIAAGGPLMLAALRPCKALSENLYD